jgi:1-acyl-sn-glycerol-3-phosphate acyltransferase
MIRNLLYAVYLVLVVASSQIVVLLPYYLLRLLRLHRAADFIMYTLGRLTHRVVLAGTGSRVRVQGLENLPADTQKVCFISNHQSYFDIPLIFGHLPTMPGFVAKIEVKKVPLLNFWTMAIGSVFIDRKSTRAAIESIRRGVEYIEEGHPLVIFPEGTRSRGISMNSFKTGSLKLAFRSKAVIVPLTVQNTYRAFEETGRVKGADITLTVHPPVRTESLDDEEKKKLTSILEERIRSGLSAS